MGKERDYMSEVIENIINYMTADQRRFLAKQEEYNKHLEELCKKKRRGEDVDLTEVKEELFLSGITDKDGNLAYPYNEGA